MHPRRMAALLPVEPPTGGAGRRAPYSALCSTPGGHAMNTEPVDEPLHAADANTLARLAAIEEHLHQIKTRLVRHR